jgi:hypothetical protein
MQSRWKNTYLSLINLKITDESCVKTSMSLEVGVKFLNGG